MINESYETAHELLKARGVKNNDFMLPSTYDNSKSTQSGKDNIWHFVREMFRVVSLPEKSYYELPINIGVAILLYMKQKKISCILCNPEHSYQSATLEAMHLYDVLYHTQSLTSRLYSADQFTEMCHDIRLEASANLVAPRLSFDNISLSNPHENKQPNIAYIDDFEHNSNSEKMLNDYLFGVGQPPDYIYGVGIANTNKSETLSQMIEDVPVFQYNMLDNLNDVESWAPKNIVRIVPSYTDIFPCGIDKLI